MAAINCFIPITVTVRGRPDAAQLEALGEALTRAVRSRLAAAAERVGARAEARSVTVEPVRAPWQPANREAMNGGYRIPSYDDGGRPTTVPVKSAGRRAGPREATVEVRWTDDAQEFYDRLARALGRSPGFRGIRADEITALAGTGTTLRGLKFVAESFHTRYVMRHSERRPGQKLSLQVKAHYDPSPAWYTPPLTGIGIAVAAPRAAQVVHKAPTAPPTTTNPPPQPPPAVTPSGRETRKERLARQSEETARGMALALLSAARSGGHGAHFVIAFDGLEIVPLSGDHSPPPIPGRDCRQGPSDRAFSEAEALAAARTAMETLLFSRIPSVIDVRFCFSGGLAQQKWTVSRLAEPPAPPPQPARGTAPDAALQADIARYRAWYDLAQRHIAAGVAAQDPTKPENLILAVTPFAAVKAAKSLKLIESADDLAATARAAERAAETAKEIRRARIAQRAEVLRLERKYAGRARTSYPPETWDYIEQLESAHPRLVGAQLRPLRRPVSAEPWVFNERMQTSQGRFSFQGTLRDGRTVQLDDITPQGWVIEVKLRNRLHFNDRASFADQLERQSLFARENGLRGVRWEVNNADTLDELWDMVDAQKIRNIVPVLVP